MQLIGRFNIISPALLECPTAFGNVRIKTHTKSIPKVELLYLRSVFLLKGRKNSVRLPTYPSMVFQDQRQWEAKRQNGLYNIPEPMIDYRIR